MATTHTRTRLNLVSIAIIFLRIGAHSFGGWSTTALLLEKQLVAPGYLTKAQLHGATTYAQILPGATQVAIVSNAGYRLYGIAGAMLATGCYLLPATSLMILFAIGYFHYADSGQFAQHLGGLIAALGGVILANAYRIGKLHANRWWLWGLVALALAAKLWLQLNAVLIILMFGVLGIAYSFLRSRRKEATHE